MFSLFLIVTYLDFLYIIFTKIPSHKKEYLFINKQIIELYCENMIFNIIGYQVL